MLAALIDSLSDPQHDRDQDTGPARGQSSNSNTELFFPVSQIRGRIRWRVPKLRHNAALKRRLVRSIAAIDGVTQVDANTWSASLLVHFGRSCDPSNVADEIARQLAADHAASANHGGAHGSGAASRNKKTHHSRKNQGLAGAFAQSDHVLSDGLVSFGAAGLSLVRIMALGRGVDILSSTAGRNAPASAMRHATGLGTGPISVVAAVTLATVGYEILKQRGQSRWIRRGREEQHRYRLELAEHLLAVDLGALESQSSARMAASIQSNLADLEKGYDALASLIDIVTGSLVLSIALFLTAPLLGLVAYGFLAAMALHIYRGYRPMQDAHGQAADLRSGVDRRMSELIEGLPVLKTFRLENAALNNLATESAQARDTAAAATIKSYHYPLRLETLTLFGVAAITLGGTFSGLSFGRHLAVMMYSGHLFFPFSNLGQTLDNVFRGAAARQALANLSRLPREPDAGHIDLPDGAPERAIRFHDVRFGYPNAQYEALRGINLNLTPGTTTVMVGTSGAGKTTIAKLLLRLHDPTAGQVTIDGLDLQTIRRSSLRSAMAVVDQSCFLFDGSIFDNIAIARPDIGKTQAWEVLNAAGAGDFVERLPAGIDTQVGPRGVRLSGGQRQRIAIARALAKQASILVLDEPTANLDLASEAQVFRSLRDMLPDSTLLLVTHRVALGRHADRIVVLDQGRIAEQGTHAELIENGQLYASLCRLN